MRYGIMLCVLILGAVGLSTPASAATNLQVSPHPVEYIFGDQVTLHVDLDPTLSVKDVQAFLRSDGDPETYSSPAQILDGQITYQHDLIAEPLRAFSQVSYWFRITPETGESFDTQTFTFFYEDNRFEWQELTSEKITIHWYSGEVDFAQHVLNAAESGLTRAAGMLKLPDIQPVNIYVYASGLDMQSTMQLGGIRWVAGHADPDLGLAVVSLPTGPDQLSETERQIPHEIMHLLIYQSVGPAYSSLPIWLKEGLASANESRANPNYYVLLTKAVEQDSLIPMSALCQSFPQDNTVYQAYAQSDSFIRFLYQQYGQTGLQNLLDSYAAGNGCEMASVSAMDKSLSELEMEWRQSALNDNIVDLILKALLPWSALLIAVLIIPLILTLTSRRKSHQAKPAEQLQ